MERKKSRLALESISRIAILSALCVVLRYAFAGLPNVQPITAIFLIVAIHYGLLESILLMSVTMLISSFLLGFGPWVLWQIISFTLVLVLWKSLLYPLTKLAKYVKLNETICQAFLAAFMGLVYGLVIDTCYALLFNMPWWTYVMAGASFNLAHALSTLLFYPILTSLFRRLLHDEKNG